jgi:hypothetical protein
VDFKLTHYRLLVKWRFFNNNAPTGTLVARRVLTAFSVSTNRWFWLDCIGSECATRGGQVSLRLAAGRTGLPGE